MDKKHWEKLLKNGSPENLSKTFSASNPSAYPLHAINVHFIQLARCKVSNEFWTNAGQGLLWSQGLLHLVHLDCTPETVVSPDTGRCSCCLFSSHMLWRIKYAATTTGMKEWSITDSTARTWWRSNGRGVFYMDGTQVFTELWTPFNCVAVKLGTETPFMTQCSSGSPARSSCLLVNGLVDLQKYGTKIHGVFHTRIRGMWPTTVLVLWVSGPCTSPVPYSQS